MPAKGACGHLASSECVPRDLSCVACFGASLNVHHACPNLFKQTEYQESTLLCLEAIGSKTRRFGHLPISLTERIILSISIVVAWSIAHIWNRV